MRRRATFILDSDQSFDPKEIQFKTRQILHPGLRAAREERLTFGLDELPRELTNLLEELHELHIRWVPEIYPASVSPFSSRLTAGLHVHYTPLNQQPTDRLCPLLQKTFSPEIKCGSVATSFSRPDVLSDRFASAASLQYHSLLPSLNHFVAYIQRSICPPTDVQCFYDAGLLNIVDYLDIDYDSISHAVTLTAFWAKAPPAIYDPIGELTTLDQWPVDISSSSRHGKVEVGILSSLPAVEPYELQLGGFLTVVGEDDKPKPTQFSFPSRHRILPHPEAVAQEYTVSFSTPTGLHPTLEVRFKSAAGLAEPSNRPDDDSTCALHAYFTLPSGVFADEYALATPDAQFEETHRVRALRSISGELDLEAPDYVVTKWGSALLLELSTPSDPSNQSSDRAWEVTVPLHLRYRLPSPGGQYSVRVPWPTLFWACTADEGTKFPTNPFDRVNLGYDGLFGPRTVFYHLKPSPEVGGDGRLVETLQVPVLDTEVVGGDRVVEGVTLVMVLLGFVWVLIRLWPGLARSPKPSTRATEKKRQ